MHFLAKTYVSPFAPIESVGLVALADHLPKNPTYAFLRYAIEARRMVTAGMALLADVQPIVDASQTETIEDPRLAARLRLMREMIFPRLVDNFQTYIVDILAEIFSSRPEMIPSGKVERRLIFSEKSLTEIRIQATEDLLRSYAYKNITELSELLQSHFKFTLLIKPEQRLEVAQMIEIRNLIVHNRGMTDYRYRKDFSGGERVEGTPVEIPNDLEALETLTAIAADIDTRAKSKFDLQKVPYKDG